MTHRHLLGAAFGAVGLAAVATVAPPARSASAAAQVVKQSADNFGGGLQVERLGTSDQGGLYIGGDNALYLQLASTIGPYFVLAANGNAALGITNPTSARLVVANGAPGITTTLELRAKAGANSSGDGAMLHFAGGSGQINLELFSDAQNSGTRVKSAGMLALHAGGVGVNADGQYLTIASVGNVGVWCTTPQTHLHVVGTVGVSDDSTFVRGAIATEGVGPGGHGKLHLQSNRGAAGPGDTTTGLTLDQSGNVGVGLTSPTARLDVNGDIRFTGAIKNARGGAAVDQAGCYFSP